MAIERAAPRRGQLPHSIAHEQAVLGMVRIDHETCWAQGLHLVLAPGDFFDRAHRLIYEAMLRLRGRDEPCFLPLVAYEIQQAGQIDEVDRLLGHGVEPYLVVVSSQFYTAAAVLVFARAIKEYADQRREIERGADIVRAAHEGRVEPAIYDRDEYRGVGSDV